MTVLCNQSGLPTVLSTDWAGILHVETPNKVLGLLIAP